MPSRLALCLDSLVWYELWLAVVCVCACKKLRGERVDEASLAAPNADFYAARDNELRTLQRAPHMCMYVMVNSFSWDA